MRMLPPFARRAMRRATVGARFALTSCRWWPAVCLVNAGGGERGPRVTAHGQSKVGAAQALARRRNIVETQLPFMVVQHLRAPSHRVRRPRRQTVGVGREPERSRDDGVVGDEIVEERLDERLGSVRLCVTRMEAAWLRTSLTSVRRWDTDDRRGSTPRAPTPRWPGTRPFAGPERPQARVPQAHDRTRAPEAVQGDGARAAD